MEEEDAFLTFVVQSGFSYSPKKVQKSRTKSSISNTKEAEDNEDNGNNDPEKTKKRGKEVFPCGVCEKNVGVSSNKCIGCKKWIHFRCHAIYGGVGWGNEENYKCSKCVRGLSGLIKKKVAIGTGRKNGHLCSNVLKTNVYVKRK